MPGRFIDALIRRLRGVEERHVPTGRPREKRAEVFTREARLTIRSGAIGLGSGASAPEPVVCLEPGQWTVCRSQGDSGVSSVALVRAELAEAGALVEEHEGSVFVDDGCVFFGDVDVLASEPVCQLLEREERTEPKHWPKDFFLTTTGIGDGIFPVTSVRAAGDLQHGMAGVMAVVVSFTVTPDLTALRQVAAQLPKPRRPRARAEPAPEQTITRNPLGLWTLRLGDAKTLAAELRSKRQWSFRALTIVEASETKVSTPPLELRLELDPPLLEHVAVDLERSEPGAKLSWDALPDFVVERF
jgi:hypothetical protein